MARTVAPGRIRIQVRNPRKRRFVEQQQMVVVESSIKRRKRLVLARGGLGNVVHFPTNYYGFLARAEGGRHGPWQLHFEATDSFWMGAAQLSLNADRARLRQILGNQTFDDVFDNGYIGQRVALRSISNRFWTYADNIAPPMALIGIELGLDELSEQFRQHQPLVVGRWYWLSVRTIPRNQAGCFVATRRDVDAQTLDIAEPVDVELLSLETLALKAPAPNAFVFRLSQAELEALHFPI